MYLKNKTVKQKRKKSSVELLEEVINVLTKNYSNAKQTKK
jgi:hypothetical protein